MRQGKARAKRPNITAAEVEAAARSRPGRPD